MSLMRLLEYISVDHGEGFKDYAYFKHILNKKSVEWIEEQIANGIDKSEKILQHENKLINTHGSQYIRFYYKGDKKNQFILRLSSHAESRSQFDNSHYSIDSWNSSPRKIKEQINEFIDYAIVYFTAIYKKEKGEELQDNENHVYSTVERGESFHSPTTYPSLDVVHRKAVKKIANKTKPNFIHLP